MERPYDSKDFVGFSLSDETLEMILEILNDPEIPEPDLIDGYPLFDHAYVWYEVFDDEYGYSEYTRSLDSSIMAVWKSVGLLIEFVFYCGYDCGDIRIYRFNPAEEFKISNEDEVYGDYECYLRGHLIQIADIKPEDKPEDEDSESLVEGFLRAHIVIKALFKFDEFPKILDASQKRAEKFKSLLVKYATLRKVQKYPAFQYSWCQERYKDIVKQASSACAYLNWCLENYSQGIDEQRDKAAFEAVQQACRQLEELYDNPRFHYEEDNDTEDYEEDYERGEWRDGKYYPDWLGGSEAEEDFWEH